MLATVLADIKRDPQRQEVCANLLPALNGGLKLTRRRLGISCLDISSTDAVNDHGTASICAAGAVRGKIIIRRRKRS